MLEDGMDKVLNGVTTFLELERVIEIPLTPTPQNEDAPNNEADLFLSHIV